ncbi:hypothetical protein CF326_g8883 [Tilletia indica]|nr:hypothetical protein CF326_g8883 [Tilletia indica]
MWFHLRLIPLRTGTQIPSTSWPAREDGHFPIQQASHLHSTSPSYAAIHFRQGTFYIRQEGVEGSIRVNGVQLTSSTEHPLLQSDIVELNRPPNAAYCADLSFRVDLSCSPSSTPIFPGPYSLVPSRARPTYAWFDDFDRALDDQSRHYGSPRPLPPLQPAVFALGECVITTSNLIPRSAEAPYPIIRPSPPCPPTDPSSSSSSSLSPLEPPGSTSVSTSVLPSTDSISTAPSATSNITFTPPPPPPTTTPSPPSTRPGTPCIPSDSSVRSSVAAARHSADTPYGDLVRALWSQSSTTPQAEERLTPASALGDPASRSSIATSLCLSSQALSASGSAPSSELSRLTATSMCSDLATSTLSHPASIPPNPPVPRHTAAEALGEGLRLHSATTDEHQLHTAVTACDRMRAAWIQTRRTLLAGAAQGCRPFSFLPTPSSALEITLARVHAAWMTAQASVQAGGPTAAVHSYSAGDSVVGDFTHSSRVAPTPSLLVIFIYSPSHFSASPRPQPSFASSASDEL